MSRNKKNDLQSVGKSLTFRGTVNEARELMKTHKCSDPVCSTQLLRVRDKKKYLFFIRDRWYEKRRKCDAKLTLNNKVVFMFSSEGKV